MKYLIGISIILLSAFSVILIELKRRRRKFKLKTAHTYSYKEAVKVFIAVNFIILIICLLIYYYSKSFQVALGLGGFFLAYSVASLVLSLENQYHIKQSGGEKKK